MVAHDLKGNEMAEDKNKVNDPENEPENDQANEPENDPATDKAGEDAPSADVAALAKENAELKDAISELLVSVRELLDSGLRFGDVKERKPPERSADDVLLDSLITD